LVNETVFDVVVAGGGPVGWACALAAQTALGKRARIAVVESAEIGSRTAAATDAPLGTRVYTIASGNLSWLMAQGAQFDWQRTASVTDIAVFGRDGQPALQVSASDAGETELATVLEHDALALAVSTRAETLGVQAIGGTVCQLHDFGVRKLVELADRRVLEAGVVVVADGMHSRLRELAGVNAVVRAYPQQGVVAHLSCQTPHRGAARQWFLPDGSILALLPLPDIQSNPAVTLVWSTGVARAAELCALAAEDLLAEVNSATGQTVAANHVIQRAQSFPMALVRVADPVASRLVVVGDAAHAIHPLAGQGVNLGLMDARELQTVWQQASAVGGDPGHALLLGRYRRNRFGPTLAMQLATDGLFRLYNQVDHPLLMAAGDVGMRMFTRLPAFRRTLSTNARQ
jgi:2-polyprenylphenol 6-hydroxylase